MVIKIKNHLHEKVDQKESNHWKYDHKQNGKPLIIEEAESSTNEFIIHYTVFQEKNTVDVNVNCK